MANRKRSFVKGRLFIFWDYFSNLTDAIETSSHFTFYCNSVLLLRDILNNLIWERLSLHHVEFLFFRFWLRIMSLTAINSLKVYLIPSLRFWVLCSFSADELLLTEMIFNGVFNDLTEDQIVAILSCFVFQEKVMLVSHLAS